jgi:hypothetical protein
MSSLVAVTAAAGVITCVALYDLATDTSGTASDAAAQGAPAVPVVLLLLWAAFFAIGRAYPPTGGSSTRRTCPGLTNCCSAAVSDKVVPVAPMSSDLGHPRSAQIRP